MTNEDRTGRRTHERDAMEAACVRLADWGLVHFGERTNGAAYRTCLVGMISDTSERAVEKLHGDFLSLGIGYPRATVQCMFDRFLRDAELTNESSSRVLAA